MVSICNCLNIDIVLINDIKREFRIKKKCNEFESRKYNNNKYFLLSKSFYLYIGFRFILIMDVEF